MKNLKHAITTLLLSSLASVASGQEAEPISYSAETYGTASGDVPMRGLGLVLELVGGDSQEPRLRLFGGPAGQPAAIVLAANAAERPGPRGSVQLVEDETITLNGAFDWRGYFEVALPADAPSVGDFHAQGVHVGVFDLAGPGEPLVQVSNGLHVFPTPEEDRSIGFDDLLLHLPPRQEHLPASATLAERLQRYLDSPGDEVKLKLHLEGSYGVAGAESEAEFVVVRTEDGPYEVRLGADFAGTLGIEVADPLGITFKGDLGTTVVYRFPSAHGAARGLMGLLLPQQNPYLSPEAALLESGVLPDAQQTVEALELTIRLARADMDQAKALLRDVLDVAADAARSTRDQARSRLKKASAELAAARWTDRPYWTLRVAVRSGVYFAAEAAYQASRIAQEDGAKALELARGVVQEHESELREVLAKAARGVRIASAVAQLRGYVLDHFAGIEVRVKGSGAISLGLPLPVRPTYWDVSSAREVEAQVAVLLEDIVGTEVGRISVTFQLEDETDLSLSGAPGPGVLIGGGVDRERKHTIVHVETFELDRSTGAYARTEASTSLERDVELRGLAGSSATVGFVRGQGHGRKRSVSLSPDLEGPELGAILRGEGLERLGAMEIGISMQDRRVRSIENDLIFGALGVGGGWELDIEWSDQGRKAAGSKTIREAIDELLHGPSHVPDEESERVATL